MKKLSLFSKLLVSNAIFAVILVTLLALMVSARNEPIKFSEWEKKGNQYQRPLEEILEGISSHKLIAQRVLHNDPRGKSQLDAVTKKVDQAFSELEATDRLIGTDLQFTDQGLALRKREHFKIPTIRAEWQEVRDKLMSLKPSESNDKHTHLIADIRTMITHSGDTSNLILDPDLDSYYLMDATLVTFPQLQDRVQEIATFVEPLLHKESLTQADRIQLAIYSALLKQSDYDRLTGDFQTALNEDKNFYNASETLQKNIPIVSKELSSALESLINILKRIEISSEVSEDPQKFNRIIEDVLGITYKSWKASITELDLLIQHRIDSHVSGKNIATSLSILALLFYGVFSIYFSRRLTAALDKTILQLDSETNQIQVAASNINEVSFDLSQSTVQQASALQETAASIEQINAMVKKSSENTSSSHEIAKRSHEVALQGKKSVEEMMFAIQEIDRSNGAIMSQVEQGNQQITEIVKVITEIGNKTKVINDIVFQTKLLSFNASVEAARAGEHGKGFAVVAEEVGNLAQMSGSAAREISEMLNGSIKKVESIIDETKTRVQSLISEGKSKVQAGSQIAKQCGEVLEGIVQNVADVELKMTEITTSSQEQSHGIAEISKAINELDQTTQKNTSTSQQASQLAQNLSNQGDSLLKLMKILEGIVRGSNETTNKSLSQKKSSSQENPIDSVAA